MIHEDPNDPMPDRMNAPVTLFGYGLGIVLTILMFVFALPATSL